MATASQKDLPPASELLVEAHRSYLRDLPELLRSHPDEWVAYSGGRRLGFARTKAEMYAACYRQNLTQDEFLVTCIEPELDCAMIGMGAAWFH